MALALHEKTQKHIDGLIKRPGGSVLFHGPGGTDKAAVALEVARQINCDGCKDESCHSCVMIKAGTHPDLIFVRPDEKGKVGIDQIHELQHQLNYSQFEVKSHRVAIIEKADTMTLPAQNALLKLLEEPPPGATMILTAVSSVGLLETIVSRCRPIYFAPTAAQQPVEDNNEAADLASRLSDASSLFLRLQAAAEAAKQGDFKTFVDLLEAMVRQKSRLEPSKAEALVAVEKLRRRLAANVNPRAAFEAFALEAVC